MTISRARHEFWGFGPKHREIGGFTLHRLTASAPEEEVEDHTHEEAHFILILAGNYKSTATGAPPVSKTPLLLFNPPGTRHRDRFLHGRGSFLAVSGGRDIREGRAVRLLDPRQISIAFQIAALFAEGENPPLLIDGCTHQLAATMLPPMSDEAQSAGSPPTWLKRVFEMIFTSGDPVLSVADLAHEAGVHPVHLARVFRRFLNCTPGELLRGRRLERAATLLGSSTASLANVALDAGFADQAHLSNAFRTAFRYSPASWRSNVAWIQDEALADREEARVRPQ